MPDQKKILQILSFVLYCISVLLGVPWFSFACRISAEKEVYIRHNCPICLEIALRPFS